MAQYSGPKYGVTDFDGSRWRDLFSNLFGIGVFKGGRVQGAAGGDLAVSATTGLGYSVATGAACIKGFFYGSDGAAVTGTLAAADPTFPRIDTIVLSWAFASGAPTCSVSVKQGTPASSPVAPTLTQNDTTYEFPLADCLVNAGATTIASVTDRRTYCAATLAYAVGHASGNIPVSDGTVNTNLNADLLDGVDSTGYAVKGTHSAGQPKLSYGSGAPGSLDANEIYFQLT